MTDSIKTGDKIRFAPKTSKRWWTVMARDERYLICEQQRPFHPQGQMQYTVVDLARTHTYNGVGPGMARSSVNSLGGGWDMSEPGWADTMLAELQSGGHEFSDRRVMTVKRIELKP